MFKSFMVLIAAMFVLTSCKKDEVKAYSEGCQYGASAMANTLGLPIPPRAFVKACDAVAEDAFNPKPVAKPSAAPAAAPEDKK